LYIDKYTLARKKARFLLVLAPIIFVLHSVRPTRASLCPKDLSRQNEYFLPKTFNFGTAFGFLDASDKLDVRLFLSVNKTIGMSNLSNYK
jgi:hypothetical protein